MPGTRCTVAVCNNSAQATKKDPDLKIIYHSFPKNDTIRKQWIVRCRRDGKWNPDSCHVCSSHFDVNDYERDLKGELLGLPLKRKLKETAVPSLNLDPETPSSHSTKDISDCTTMDRTLRQSRRAQKQLVKDLIQDPSVTDVDDLHIGPDISIDSSTAQLQDQENLACQCNSGKEVKFLKKSLGNLEQQYHLLKLKYIDSEIKNKNYQQHISMNQLGMSQLKKELKRLKKMKESKKGINDKVKSVLRKVFSESQIKLLMDGKKRVNWSSEDVAVAFTLRYLSKRAYIYLREKLNFPLPALSTLQKWASNLNLKKGILTEVLKIMNVAGLKLSPAEKLVVLQFDEMKTKEVYEYDVKSDQVMGRHSQMQVVLARGLFSKWKQPIYIGFDQKMTKTIFDLIVVELAKIDYRVIVCVCDMGGGNQGFWKDLGIDMTKTWYPNPSNRDLKIFCFADAPHLLKLLRNWLIDTGFKLEDGKVVSKEPLQILINADNNELKICPNLKPLYLNCKNTERQNVRLAAQLISHKAATALQHCRPLKDSEQALVTVEFINLVNQWFDIMNSYVRNVPGHPEKSAYGENLEEQNKILQEMSTTIVSMRCCGKNALQVFQKSIFISITSLQLLYQEVVESYGKKFLLTHRLNQDALENLFSQLRTRGGLDDHPTPLNALYRIRMIMLGKNPGIVKKNTNTEEQSNEEYLCANFLKECGVIAASASDDLENSLENDETDIVKAFATHVQSEPFEKAIDCKPSEIEKDGLNYIAGWVARKVRKTNPELGCPTRDLPLTMKEHLYNSPTWVQRLSYGGLIEPSSHWKVDVEKLEKVFQDYHGKDTLSKVHGVVGNLTEKTAVVFSDIPKTAIYNFFRIRTFIRIKYLNNKIRKPAKGHSVNNPASKREATIEEQKRCRKICKYVQ